ncbi:stage 0 sporulation protein J [Candidatus Wolfebacteria bacterium CG10_big_fil_rev_8_21_14_0_10_31_9]|uniref:Stage 0 sporulation protein J n=1 Tax=Candidatus Wolfebacteria bacterium CG10_big_fil_rev_8_21_14_0_10_31_9 TaxID=1975070 RepID=A0A2H0RBN0_9BACT|nr:MAG: stage 0 sporulation protein J [Candidatus Wolfebacteria bacterium CG10_big_fil_rev_8_21_14_0_10_31_9]
MIGQGLNSLIPPKKTTEESLYAQDTQKTSNGNSFNSIPQKTDESKSVNSPIAQNINPNPISQNNPKFENTTPGNRDFDLHSQPIRQYKKTFINDAIFHIEVEKIKPNPYQPRKNFNEESLRELASSIGEFGILQPLVVSKIEKDTEMGTDVEYQLIAGERRLQASKLIGMERVPVIIRTVSQKVEQLELAIIENIQRANLDVIETARAYARLSDEFSLTQREIAQRVSKSRETVANTLRLLGLPQDIQEAVSKGQISESQGRLLLSITNPVIQNQMFKDLLANSYTVRELRHKIEKNESHKTHKSIEQKAKEYEMKDLELKLKEALGAEVKIQRHGETGKIVISFYSSEEIYGIINKIHIEKK